VLFVPQLHNCGLSWEVKNSVFYNEKHAQAVGKQARSPVRAQGQVQSEQLQVNSFFLPHSLLVIKLPFSKY
jgi:hypothetical protein